MRKILVIGIGAGNPDHVTVQAVKAMNKADVLFIPDKGAEKADLAQVRRDICERHITNQAYRTVGFRVPVRRPNESYDASVDTWHREVEAAYVELLTGHMSDGECAAFLVWGDPSLYDSTLRILQAIEAKGTVEFDWEIIPGITSVQVLAARHKIALNKIGDAIHITTGRRLIEGFPENADSVVVMLDGELAFKTVEDQDTHIYWGACLGTEDEIILSGRLGDVAGEIECVRRQAREKKGWLMDTYLLRKER